MNNYKDFVQASLHLKFTSSIEDVIEAIKRADTLPHWFDQRRALGFIAGQICADPDLVYKLAVRGGK